VPGAPDPRSSSLKSFEFTIRPLQDGPAAGQTVPHVHFHILPRKLQGDIFQSNRDAVYPAIERAESELHADLEQAADSPQRWRAVGEPLKMDADVERRPRELEEMIKEAEWLRSFFEAEKAVQCAD
jgi:bis(5'-adenosyl)-triphosphatase